MGGGYTGKLLFVDLTSGSIEEETPSEEFYRSFLGGYGLGTRILYEQLDQLPHNVVIHDDDELGHLLIFLE